AQKRPALRDKVGVIPVPGSWVYYTPNGEEKAPKQGINRVPYLGGAGWLALVPRSSARPQAAWGPLPALARPARGAQIALERLSGGSTRTAHLVRERWDAYGLDPTRSQALKEALARTLQPGIKNPVVCLRIPDQASHREAMVAGLRAALLDRDM